MPWFQMAVHLDISTRVMRSDRHCECDVGLPIYQEGAQDAEDRIGWERILTYTK